MTDAALVDEELGLKQAKATSSYGAADEDQRRTGPVRSHAAGPRPGQHVRDVVGRHAQEVILDVLTPLPSSSSRPTTLTFFYVYFGGARDRDRASDSYSGPVLCLCWLNVD